MAARLHALRPIGDELLGRPAGRIDAAAQFFDLARGHLDSERTDSGVRVRAGAAHDRVLPVVSPGDRAIVLYNIRWYQGRLDEIADFFLDAARDNPSISALRSSIPRMLCELGRFDESSSALRGGGGTRVRLPVRQHLARLHEEPPRRCGEHGGSPGNANTCRSGRPMAWAGIVPAAVIVDGAIARPLARGATLLGDYDRAEEWIGVAHEIHVRLQAPFFIALGQLDHADRATNRLSGL
jgi:hypothetical protein